MKDFELYLIILGARSTDYSYTPEVIYDNIDYFRSCFNNDMSTYKSLELFSFELSDKV